MITHAYEPGPELWNPFTQRFERNCMRCQSCLPHISRLRLAIRRLRLRERLVTIRVGMDLAAHNHFMDGA